MALFVFVVHLSVSVPASIGSWFGLLCLVVGLLASVLSIIASWNTIRGSHLTR